MYYPNLRLPEDAETRPVGLYGSFRRTYLKGHRPVLYMELVLSGKLTTHLADINEAAQERMELITKQMAKQQGITEQLKASDWLKWVQSMNNIQSADERLCFLKSYITNDSCRSISML